MDIQKIFNALTYDAAYTFEFDVTTGMIEKDLIGSDGTNYMKKAGLSAPCLYNDLVEFYFGQQIRCRILSGCRIRNISSEFLLNCCLSGKIRCEINIFYPVTNSYYRIPRRKMLSLFSV